MWPVSSYSIVGVKQLEAHLDLQKVKDMAAKSNDLMGHLRFASLITQWIRSSAPANPVQLYIIDSSIPDCTDIVNFKKSAKIQHLDI